MIKLYFNVSSIFTESFYNNIVDIIIMISLDIIIRRSLSISIVWLMKLISTKHNNWFFFLNIIDSFSLHKPSFLHKFEYQIQFRYRRVSKSKKFWYQQVKNAQPGVS